MTRNILPLGLVTIVALCVSGCKTDLTAINTDPNNPTTAPVGAVFTSAAIGAVGTFSSTGVTLSMTSLFAQHMAQVQYIDEDRGHIRAGTIDFLFAGGYSSALIGLSKVKAEGVAATADHYA